MNTISTERALATGFVGIEEVPGVLGARSALGYRLARSGELRDAYPSGTHDVELGYLGQPDPVIVAEYTQTILHSDPRCRRVVLPVPEQDLAAIGWAEEAGYRYVIDVETTTGGYSLLVTEPQWVIDQPSILEDIPLKD